jgi:phosphohistidine phosphatase
MQLYLLRHANADTHAPTDGERPLSDKGFEQARRIGRFCAKNAILPELILASPLLRTCQTAELVAKELKSGGFEVASFLASGMDPQTAVHELQAYRRLSRVMLVGHEPDISLLIAGLLGLHNHSQVHIRKGSLTSLQVTAWRSGGTILEFSIPCQLM